MSDFSIEFPYPALLADADEGVSSGEEQRRCATGAGESE
jgi:hypothetical protein